MVEAVFFLYFFFFLRHKEVQSFSLVLKTEKKNGKKVQSCGQSHSNDCVNAFLINAAMVYSYMCFFLTLFNPPLSLSSKSVLKLYSETQRDKGRIIVAIRFLREEVQKETRRGDEEGGGWNWVLASVPTKTRVG